MNEYGKLRYPIHNLKEGESVFTIPILNEIPVFKQEVGLPNGVDNETLMKYIILCYSRTSPAVEKYSNIGKRKTWVMNELGIPQNSNKEYSEGWNSVLMNYNPLAVQKIAAFLTLDSPDDWATLISASEQLFAILQLPYPKEDRDANERIKQINSLKEQIKSSKEEVLKIDTAAVIEMGLGVFKAYSTLGLRPEERVLEGFKFCQPKHARGHSIYPEIGN